MTAALTVPEREMHWRFLGVQHSEESLMRVGLSTRHLLPTSPAIRVCSLRCQYSGESLMRVELSTRHLLPVSPAVHIPVDGVCLRHAATARRMAINIAVDRLLRMAVDRDRNIQDRSLAPTVLSVLLIIV